MDVVEIKLEIESEDGCCVSKRAKVCVPWLSLLFIIFN